LDSYSESISHDQPDDQPQDRPNNQIKERWVVIHKFRTIGDAIFHMHAFHAIAAVAPQHRIVLAMPGSHPSADLFVDDPAIEKVVFIARNARFRWGRIKNISVLRQEHFSRVWILGRSTSYAMTALCAGIKERLGYGIRWPERICLTRRLYRPMPRPIPTEVPKMSWAFLETYGIERLPDGQKPVFTQTRLQQAYDQYADLPRPWIVFGIGASHAHRRWPSTCWVTLADALVQQWGGGGTLFLCGGEQDRGTASYIASSLTTKPSIVYLIGEHLSVIASILQHAYVFVGNDSGLFHLAGAMNTCPVVGLFGVSPVFTYLPNALQIAPPRGISSSMHALTPYYVTQQILQHCQFI
jgi:ADP-heptose:LPS heptosyltransferase